MSEGQAAKKAEKNFVWTDDETALLVQIIIDYKAAKASSGLDWETGKRKYDELIKRLQK